MAVSPWAVHLLSLELSCLTAGKGVNLVITKSLFLLLSSSLLSFSSNLIKSVQLWKENKCSQMVLGARFDENSDSNVLHQTPPLFLRSFVFMILPYSPTLV